MGVGMAMNILKAGHEVIVHNRTRQKEESLAAEGAQRAASPREAAANAEIIVICVSDTPDVEGIILGDEGVIHGAPKGSIVVDMSTISPSAARRMAEMLAEMGVGMLDAPVSGGSEGAQNGTLSIMVGGETAVFKKALPILETMGKTITHVGDIGAGQVTKAINQIVITGTYLTMAEGLTIGMKAGLDMEKVLQAIGGGAASSWVLHNRGQNVIENTYPLGLETARELGATLPATALVAQMENGLIERGFGDDDISAIARVIREQSGL
jgi:3-hydroxyisobutyrate dehydrogenase